MPRRLSCMGRAIGAIICSFVTLDTHAQVTQQAKLHASDAGPHNSFGHSTGLSGDYALVGAPSQQNTTGASYVFIRSGTTWTQQAKLLAADGVSPDAFGQSVAISGSTALVGAYADDSVAGSAYVFVRSGTDWTQQAKLVASDRASLDSFGQFVAVDGDYALIGSRQDDDNGSDSGSAYVFARSGMTWSEQAKLLPSDGGALDYFGYTVSINGSSALVGSIGGGLQGGAAYVFTRTGSAWTQQAKLEPSDGEYADDFGVSVSIDGDYAVVGARDDIGYAGAAYVFHRTGTNWTQQAKLTASDAASVHYFGDSVSLNGDFALVGAKGNDSLATDAGAAYLFRRFGTTWTELAKITVSDGSAYDFFGTSVSLDGYTALVGALADTDFSVDSGSAYVFSVPEPTSATLLVLGGMVVVRRSRSEVSS